ncbi:MAG TPA: formimidoylglutamate deiminase [Caulobacteraceae bacterium]|jgi:formiminoglutamate deiminase
MTSLWFATALLPDGWASSVRLTLADGRIATVETGVAPAPGDERGRAGLPGVGNLHSHAFQRAMAGLAETRAAQGGDDFWSWREVMYRFVGRLTPDDVEAIAAQAYAEMLESGFTRVGEFHYLHHDVGGAAFADPAEMTHRIVAAANETGIGLTLLPVFYAHGGFGGQPSATHQQRFTHSLGGFGQLMDRAKRSLERLPDGVLGVAPHSLRAVTPDELAALIPLAGTGPIHIHVAEQAREVSDCLDWSGQRPVAWLLDHAPVDARWCLVHATHVDANEVAGLVAGGATAGLCPITEANLGDGLFPAVDYLAKGGAFGIGSDSNVLIDLAEELRLLEYGQRLTALGRNRLGSGAELFKAAQLGGARALGLTHPGLEVGASADILSLNLDHPALCGKTGDTLLDGWVFAARGGAVDTVWRRGAKVVEGGRHVRAHAIAERYRRILARVLAE